MTASKTLTINDIKNETRMKAEYRNDPSKEYALRQQAHDHLAYIHAEKLWNVKDSRWAHRQNSDGKTTYIHFFNNHAITATLQGPVENPIVVIVSDSDYGTMTLQLSMLSTAITEIGLVVGALALFAQIGFYAESVEGAVAAAALALTGVEGSLAEITFAGAAGPIGIAIAVLAMIVMLAIYMGERQMILSLRYENRSVRQSVSLLKCWTWNLPDLKTPARLAPIHQIGGIDVYDVAVYNHDNARWTEGIGLSLLFQSDEGYANICIRNDIYHNPQFAIATGQTPIDPEDFYYNLPSGQINQDKKWGNLVIKSYFNPVEFNDYKFNGIISFNDV